jgi:hypothetical protein
VNNESSKTTIHITNISISAYRMELLCFLKDFNCASATMGWSTGLVTFEKFPIHLQGTGLDSWLSTAKPYTGTIANFHLFVHRLRQSKFLNNSYNGHIDFLHAICLPKFFDPSHFSPLLALHNMLLSELPGAPATPS